MLKSRSTDASGQHITEISMQLRLCTSQHGDCIMTAQTSYLLYHHAMQILPLVAKEGFVLVMRHFQCINADYLHEDRVDDVIEPVNNELDPTLACAGLDCAQVSMTAALRNARLLQVDIDAHDGIRSPSLLPKKEGASGHVFSRYSAIRQESTTVVSPSTNTGTYTNKVFLDNGCKEPHVKTGSQATCTCLAFDQ
jgi:hypothetical protein